MLKVFRDNIKYLSWILWVVIGLFVLFVFVDFGTGIRGRNAGAGTYAAKVGSQTVSMLEFQRQYQMLEDRYRQMYGAQFTPELAKQMRLPLQALDRLVDQRVLLAEAGRLGLSATDAEVRDRILSIPAFKDEQGRFVGEAAYAQYLQGLHYSVQAFEEEMRKEVLLEKLNNILLANAYVGDDEVERAYREQVEKAKIRYVQLPRASFAEVAANLPQSELAAYFQAHKQDFRLPEQREVGYLLVDSAKLLGQIKIDDKELQSYYDQHKDEFNQEEQVRARHILVQVNDQRSDAAAKQRIEEAKQRLEKGADFAAVAREFSEDTASKANGGDLGYFGRNRMVKEFADAAFGAQPGKLVGPVKSSFGYHLIEVTDRRPGGLRPFAEVREQIQARLASQRVQEEAQAKAKGLADRLAREKPASVQAFAAAAAGDPTVTFATAGPFGQQDMVQGIGRSPTFNGAAFALAKGKVSDPVQVPQGWAVVYLKDVRPPRTPELADVEPRVRQAVASEKQQKMALDRLAQARAAGKTLEQVAAELHLEVKESQEFGGQGMIPGLGYSPELAKAALALPQGQIGGPVADAQGAVLFQVTEHKGWDPAQFAAAREQTRARVQQEKLGRMLAALVEQKKLELGVSYDKSLVDQYGLGGDASRPG
jgi:peptidyl-prolyl cis-trans isomerase D